MLYLIGGAARAGKTLLARRLLAERGVPCFCADYLVSGLQEGVPELGILGESPNRERAPRLWPILAPLLRNIIEVEPAYTVESDVLWPRGVAALRDENPDAVRACFIGYAGIAPAAKVAQMRRYGGGVNDWVQHHDDAYALALAQVMIAWSAFLRDECAALGLEYVDVSIGFEDGLAQAKDRLTAA
ncbi:MAG: hypothetical protein V1772_04560 [Chloroflexota bacterium]